MNWRTGCGSMVYSAIEVYRMGIEWYAESYWSWLLLFYTISLLPYACTHTLLQSISMSCSYTIYGMHYFMPGCDIITWLVHSLLMTKASPRSLPLQGFSSMYRICWGSQRTNEDAKLLWIEVAHPASLWAAAIYSSRSTDSASQGELRGDGEWGLGLEWTRLLLGWE